MNPTHYLLIGRGRLARHLQHYFTILGLSFSTWDRTQALSLLQTHVEKATHVLLLVKDNAINEVAQRCKQFSHTAIFIHCSGSLVTDEAYGVHPLMTFNTGLYDLQTYQDISFIVDSDAPAFADLLPELPNPHARLEKNLKPRYHALCVLGGNFSCLLWQKFFDGLKEDLKLDPALGRAFLKQQMNNLLDDPSSALTGPLVRGDEQTLASNITALEGDPFQAVYESFVKAYGESKE